MCPRLTLVADECLEHRRGVRNTLSVCANADLLLTGVLVYTGRDEDLLDESVPVTFDRATTSVRVVKDGLQVAVAETVVGMGWEEGGNTSRREGLT